MGKKTVGKKLQGIAVSVMIAAALMACPMGTFAAVIEFSGLDAICGTVWNDRFWNYGFEPGEMQTYHSSSPGGTIWTKGISMFSLGRWYATGAAASSVTAARFSFDGYYIGFYQLTEGYDIQVAAINTPDHPNIAGEAGDFFYADTTPAGLAVHSGSEMHACIDVTELFRQDVQSLRGFRGFLLEGTQDWVEGFFSAARLEVEYDDSLPVQPVPEPSALLLLSSGLLSAAGLKKYVSRRNR